jgi:hypothetical protein
MIELPLASGNWLLTHGAQLVITGLWLELTLMKRYS